MGLDCNITKNYMKEKDRFCGYMKKHAIDFCIVCELSKKTECGTEHHGCESVPIERRIEVVQYFSDNGIRIKKIKTYLDDFKDKYPNADYRFDGTPANICPQNLGYCVRQLCRHDCVSCWNQEFTKIHRTSMILD